MVDTAPTVAERAVAEQKPSNADNAKLPVPSRQANLNRNVMRTITSALEADPGVDILSVIPASYKSRIAKISPPRTTIAHVNRETLDSLQSLVNEAPEVDMLLHFPDDYRSTYDRAAEDPDYNNFLFTPKPKPQKPEVPDTLTRLASAKEAVIKFPLSESVYDLISQHAIGTKEPLEHSKTLAISLKRLFEASEKIWELNIRGAVFKCNDEIVAKVIRGTKDSTEYTSMQYLQEHASDIPAPRPHGLVHLGYFRVIFMTYIPSMTLEKAWPSLSQGQKVSVRDQLNEIVTRMRELKKPSGYPLGGIGGEGAKDLHLDMFRSDKPIHTEDEFKDFKFLAPKWASKSYINFLKSFLPPTSTQLVFTHGDFRPANIMVQMVQQDDCLVTGIIDWEDGGFYPEFHEATKVTNLLSAVENTDWYEYVPKCIAPSSFPLWWLVDRLLDISIRLLQ